MLDDSTSNFALGDNNDDEVEVQLDHEEDGGLDEYIDNDNYDEEEDEVEEEEEEEEEEDLIEDRNDSQTKDQVLDSSTHKVELYIC